MLDSLKLGLVYIIESVVRCHHKKTVIDLFHLKIVDDFDASTTIRRVGDVLRTLYTFSPYHTRSPIDPCISTILMDCPILK